MLGTTTFKFPVETFQEVKVNCKSAKYQQVITDTYWDKLTLYQRKVIYEGNMEYYRHGSRHSAGALL